VVTAKIFDLRTGEVLHPIEDRTIRSFVNPRMKLEAAQFGVWMYVSGQTHLGSDPYLWIRKGKNTRRGYQVRGIYGWAGMGYDGFISTRSLISGLRRLGFRIDARTLREMILKAPVR
jgi:hypothetical protein